MNLDRIQTPSPALRPAAATPPRRLDVTSDVPAGPSAGTAAPVARPASTPAAGASLASIRGVLTPDEERAIAHMFEPSRSGYSPTGARAQAAEVPGQRLNVQA